MTFNQGDNFPDKIYSKKVPAYITVVMRPIIGGFFYLPKRNFRYIVFPRRKREENII